MFLFSLACLLGDVFLQTCAVLPPQSIIYVVLGASLCTIILGKWKLARIIAGFLFGFSYTAWIANAILGWTLPKEWEGKPILVSGYIKSIPITTQFGTQFEFLLDAIISNRSAKKTPSILIRLNYKNPSTTLKVGDHWQWLVKLKRIHGIQSPGAFDFEAWAIQNRLRASGYIVTSPLNHFINHKTGFYPLNQIRQKVLVRLQTLLPQTESSRWLPALIVGERQGIAQEQWQVLRNTGTNHLMAIAGLHIGILAGFTYALINWLWRRFTRCMLWMPTSHASAMAALLIAVFYSALAGFSVPTQRACLMLLTYNFTLLRNVVINPWYVWSMTLFIVVITNPLVILSESFWLSFMTIALIFYGMAGRLAPCGWWWKWGRAQWVIGVGLIPLSLAFFQQSSLISFGANIIAIPWLALFILPFCFLSTLCLFIVPQFAKVLLLFADHSLSLLWVILTGLAHLNFATWQQAIPNTSYLMLTLASFIVLLLPSGMPGRWLSGIFILPLILYQAPIPVLQEAWVSILDVGQGLSVIVQTQNHVLVYDTGPKLNPDMDMGENVVLPFLRIQTINQIDRLVISHGDNDHIGGANALLRAMPITRIDTSVPEKFSSSRAELCLSNQSWQWDGITFTFLYPTQSDLHANNDSSCVLKVDNGFQSVILPGDIEKYAERQLLQAYPTALRSSYLIAPHHGSKTSGIFKFIQAVHPQWVFYATGYKNRYHFPDKSVMKNYQIIATKQFNTAELGTLQFKLLPQTLTLAPESYRVQHARYWLDH